MLRGHSSVYLIYRATQTRRIGVKNKLFVIMKKIVLILTLSLFTFIVNAQRQTVSLNGSWGFSIDSLKQGIAQRWFQQGIPATIVAPVTVPHTWNVKKETVSIGAGVGIKKV